MNARDNRQLLDLSGLDVLRGMLAVFVVAHHARWLCWIGQAQWRATEHPWWSTAIAYNAALFRYGHEAVMVFFALSGFFIHLRVAKQIPTQQRIEPLDTRRFAQRRFHRLAAPYFLVLLLTVGLDSIGRDYFANLYFGHTENALLNQNFSSGDYSVRAVLPALVMLPRSMGVTFGSNGPLWSLGYEVIYYALYPLWLIVRRQSRSLAYIVIPIICLGIASLKIGTWLPAVLSHWPIWIAGAGLGEWLMTWNHRKVHREGVWTPGERETDPTLDRQGWLGSRTSFCVLGLAFSLIGFVISQFVSATVAILLGYILLGNGSVLMFCTFPRIIARMRWVSCWQFLGLRSYTIYILHFPVLTLMAASFYSNGGPPASGWFALIATIGTTLICVAAFEVCERRFLHARIRLEGNEP